VSSPRTNERPHGLRLGDLEAAQKNITEIDPLADPRWRQLVDRVDSSVFHSPQWLRVLADTYGFELRAILALDDGGEPVAGIPFARISDIIDERIVSLPFSDYCDPLVSDRYEWNNLIEGLLAEECPITVKCLHNTVPLADVRFITAGRAKWHGLDVRSDLETLWQGLDEAARRAIRKAQRDGVVVRIAEDEETVRAFFEMHFRSRKYKYRLLAQPYSFFRNIWQLILEPGNGALMVATHGDEIIAGTLFLEWHDKLYYKFNASVPSHLSHRPNDLLIWTGIKYAKERMHHYLDFGLSDWDQEPLLQFKRKYASEEKTISVLKFSPVDGSPREKERRALLSRLAELFTEETVPDNVTNRAGEMLYRFFV
jgi:CelD/BcsL family acetyltransferase involved in cellulose biosynthesis